MHISWDISGTSGSADADSVDDAAEVLTDAVRSAYADAAQATVVHLLLNAVTPLREQLVTVGAAALERGEAWCADVGGIAVHVVP